MSDFSVKRGDTLPALIADLTDSNAVAIDLTTVSTKTLLLRRNGIGEAILRTATVVGLATAGRLQYAWVVGDWTGASAIVAGTYSVEFELVYASGQKLTVPTAGYLTLIVYEDLA